MNSDFSEIMRQLREQYGAQLAHMPLPEGVPEHVAELVSQGDVEGLILMIKLSWMFGAQAGHAAAHHTQVLRPRNVVQA
ncbi:hypothetical protein HNR42_003265 [Deinobacterium chartae]|uniref:Uncharacterized protein n=1 Tax=Deinobacterium chartae TaxID=521158 RepID=A0A841I299_9DEIO|nr:DdrH [Deinobacterium chartae]MBB6099807.1 hypothetical protein [Deinobacterium chartae]